MRGTGVPAGRELIWFGFVGNGAPLSFQALWGNAAGCLPTCFALPAITSQPPSQQHPPYNFITDRFALSLKGCFSILGKRGNMKWN